MYKQLLSFFLLLITTEAECAYCPIITTTLRDKHDSFDTELLQRDNIVVRHYTELDEITINIDLVQHYISEKPMIKHISKITVVKELWYQDTKSDTCKPLDSYLYASRYNATLQKIFIKGDFTRTDMGFYWPRNQLLHRLDLEYFRSLDTYAKYNDCEASRYYARPMLTRIESDHTLKSTKYFLEGAIHFGFNDTDEYNFNIDYDNNEYFDREHFLSKSAQLHMRNDMAAVYSAIMTPRYYNYYSGYYNYYYGIDENILTRCYQCFELDPICPDTKKGERKYCQLRKYCYLSDVAANQISPSFLLKQFIVHHEEYHKVTIVPVDNDNGVCASDVRLEKVVNAHYDDFVTTSRTIYEKKMLIEFYLTEIFRRCRYGGKGVK
jgi:hypothetical protein